MPITRNLRTQLLSLPRPWKRLTLIAFDFVALSFSLWVGYGLRYDTWHMPTSLDQWSVILSAPLIAIPIFVRAGLYRAVIRYLPERALWTVFQAMIVATGAWIICVFLAELVGRGGVPRSVPLIYFVLGSALVAGSRFLAKAVFWPQELHRTTMRPALIIYGAGDAGTHLANSLRSSHRIVGFLDDDVALHRRDVAGIRVFPPSQLVALIAEFQVRDCILSIPSLTPSRRKEIVTLLGGHGLKIRSLPAIGDLVTGKYLVSQIKEIDLDDLLGRSSIPPDTELIRQMVVGRSIMVTGAGGSIGSELCRKIARWNPQRLVLFEANEFALYNIERELDQLAEVIIVPVLGSVIDDDRVRQAIIQNDVRVIFHAAAHKHVPLVEKNALEGIKNNVFGTKTVTDAAFDLGVEHFVLISTDKAVRPTNVMGATKRWAELIMAQKAALAVKRGTGQRFCAVRFGNVLGSNGSVVPLFKEQIANGGPITLTDPAMTRYFMSIHEAAELIVQAGALSEGGDVFILDMGEPMLISDLAENMIQLAGLTVRSLDRPDGDIEIIATGKRPGEKMFEELFYDERTAERTSHPKIMRTPSLRGLADVDTSLDRLLEKLGDRDEAAAKSILFEIVFKNDGLNDRPEDLASDSGVTSFPALRSKR